MNEVDELTICNDYVSGMTILSIINKYHRAGTTIRKCLIKHNINIRPSNRQPSNKFTDTLINETSINQLIIDYKSGLGFRSLIKKYNSSYKRLKRLLSLNGVLIRSSNHYGLADRDNKIKSLFKIVRNTSKIANQLDLAKSTVIRSLVRQDIPRLTHEEASRRYTIDISRCNDLTSEIGSYWLGFMLADGCITQKRPNRLSCSLARRDINHLYLLAQDLGTTKIPTIGENFSFGKIHQYSRFIVDNTELCNTYLTNGWREFKDGKINLGNINLRHLLRGLMDGDGIITVSELHGKPNLCIGFCSPHIEIVEWYRKQIVDMLGVRMNKISPKRRGCYYIMWSGTGAVKIGTALYTNQSRCLKRKLDKIMPYLVAEEVKQTKLTPPTTPDFSI